LGTTVDPPARPQALDTAGATLTHGDLLDATSLASAFAGIDAIYAITTPFEHGSAEEQRQGEAIIRAALDAELPWLILASVAAAQRSGVPHFISKARIEQRLAATTVPWTVIAPRYFCENVLGSAAPIRDGRLPMAIPGDQPLHQVALADLGALVAAVIKRRDEHMRQRIEVAGDAPTPKEMAIAIGVRYENVPLEQIRTRSDDLAAMYEFLSTDGYRIDVAAVRARYPEINWTSFADWAAMLDWG